MDNLSIYIGIALMSLVYGVLRAKKFWSKVGGEEFDSLKYNGQTKLILVVLFTVRLGYVPYFYNDFNLLNLLLIILGIEIFRMSISSAFSWYFMRKES